MKTQTISVENHNNLLREHLSRKDEVHARTIEALDQERTNQIRWCIAIVGTLSAVITAIGALAYNDYEIYTIKKESIAAVQRIEAERDEARLDKNWWEWRAGVMSAEIETYKHLYESLKEKTKPETHVEMFDHSSAEMFQVPVPPSRQTFRYYFSTNESYILK